MKALSTTALRSKHEIKHPDSHFFDKEAMRFFGDTMSNYKVGRQVVICKRYDGTLTPCWELVRRKPVKHGLQSSAFFSVDTFEHMHFDKVVDYRKPTPAEKEQLA